MNPSHTGYILRLLYAALGGLVAVLAFGTIGYMELTDGNYSWFDCFYMTFITIATIGFAEIIDMTGNQPARMLTVAIGILGAGDLSILFSIVTVFILESDLNGTLQRKRMEKMIRKLKGHYVLCGFGRVGRNIARELEATKHRYVAIDEEIERLDEYKEKNPGFLYLNGDASDDDVLLVADLEDAKGLFAVTGDDSRNLMIVITAKQIKPTLRVVARCSEERNIEKMRKAGADAIVSPDLTGGMRIASAMIRPHVASFLEEMRRSVSNLRVEDIPIPAGFIPKPMGALQPRGDNYILLAARERNGNWQFNPDAEYLLKPGFTLVAMVTPEGRRELETLLIDMRG
ncbi:MAG: NAD-binding protein [Candidatus Dechloromonas phosphoritropha]